jgi:ATP-dependent Clp protease ATP-binding subunit ClpX
MEGFPAKVGDKQFVDTTNILFICGGAFVGLENIMSKTHGYGFISTTNDDNQNILDRLNTRVKPTDLFEFGLIPEFTGRLPIIANFQTLSRKMLVRIMTEPRNSIYNQFREMEYKTGARSLRGIFEELINPLLYLVPDDKEIQKVVVTSLFTDAQIIRKPPAAAAG